MKLLTLVATVAILLMASHKGLAEGYMIHDGVKYTAENTHMAREKAVDQCVQAKLGAHVDAETVEYHEEIILECINQVR